MMLNREEAKNINDLRNRCDNQRDYLDGALNRMHLATTYEELEEWYDWSRVHLRELDKLLHQKLQFLDELKQKKR